MYSTPGPDSYRLYARKDRPFSIPDADVILKAPSTKASDKGSIASRYEAKRWLGSGVGGATFLCVAKGTNDAYAVKITPLEQKSYSKARHHTVYPTARNYVPTSLAKLKEPYSDETSVAAREIFSADFPVVDMEPEFSEARNWYLINVALEGSGRSPAYEGTPHEQSNCVRIVEHQRVEWTKSDCVEFLGGNAASAKEMWSKLVELSTGDGTMVKFVSSCESMVVVLERVYGETVNDSIRTSPENMYERKDAFLSVWTQVACTLCFLRKRISLAHGDLHGGNVMLVPVDAAFPPKFRKGRTLVLRYRLPIEDGSGSTRMWEFYVHEPRFVAKIIDMGYSKAKLLHAEDAKRLGTDDRSAYIGRELPFYAFRGDANAFALAYFHKVGDHIEANIDGRDLGSVREKRDEIARTGRVMLDAFERNAFANGTRPVAEELGALWSEFERYDPKVDTDMGARIGYAYRRNMSNLYKCFQFDKNRSNDCPAPDSRVEPPSPDLDPGRWTIDEHLVLFSGEHNGQPVVGHRSDLQFPITWRAPSWLERINSGSPADIALAYEIVDMLPHPSTWPATMPKGDHKSTPFAYPAFRCCESGDGRLDRAVRRYRREMDTCNSLLFQ